MRTSGFFKQLATSALVGMVALGPSMHVDALRFMVVGDSISHGTEGDFTWRYRLWEWFRDNGVSADFVGPYTGTHVTSDPAPPGPPRFQGEREPMQVIRAWGGYARGIDGGFPKGHFAVWGRQVAQAKGLIREMVAAYQPEMLLVELGFNDLGWFVSGPQGTIMSMGDFVAQARAAKGDLKIAIANVPQRTFIGGRDDLPVITHEYNTMLATEIPKWSTGQSPVILVPFRTEFQCEVNNCPAAYDGLHPNALGEYQIARAFSMALNHHWKIGRGPLNVPSVMPGRDVSAPSNFRAASSALGVTVTWDKVYGATGYDLRNKIKGFGDWVDPQYSISMNRADTVWTVDGIEWEYMVRAAYGNTKGPWVGPVSAVAHPTTAPGPKNIKVIPTGDGATLTWDPPEGGHAIDRYEVITYDQDTPGAFLTSFGVGGRSATVTGLKAGHKHVVAITTWTSVGGGLPAGANAIRPGGGTPPAPTNLRVWTVAEGATVQLRHDASPGAAGYRYYTRNINDPNSKSTADPYAADSNCWGMTFLFPGAWNYEFCVTAFNGDLESGKSNCVVAPKTISDPGGCPLPPSPPSGPALPPAPIPGDSNWQIGGGGGGSAPGPIQPSEDYKGVKCTDIGIINDNDPIDWRWAQVHASQAWSQASFSWRMRDKGTNRLSFTEYISNFFNGPRGMECHKLAPANGCKGTFLQCHDTNYPAGYFILNSFMHLSSILWNFWDALRGARADIATDANTMVSVFSPTARNDAMPIAIIIDIVTIGFAGFAAPFWNSIMKKRPFFQQNGNTHGVLKDSVNGAVAGGLTLVKDLTRADARLTTSNELVVRLKAITDIWFEATESFNNMLFSGESDSINRMRAFIDAGRMLDETEDILSSREIESLARRALFAMLIPVAWKISGRDLGPFILNGKVACDKYMSSLTVTRAVQDKTRVCVDGNSYFLAGASEPSRNCKKDGDIGGVCDPFKELPGMSQLDGRQWGGVTKEDIVIGSLNSYKKNGDKNGGKAVDPVDYDFLSTVQDINVRAPGMINIAMCGAIEAERNYWNAFEGKHSTNYPCD